MQWLRNNTAVYLRAPYFSHTSEGQDFVECRFFTWNKDSCERDSTTCRHPTLYLCPRTLSAEQRLAYAAVLTTFPALHSTDVAILEEIGEALARIRVTSWCSTRCLEERGMDGVQGQREFERWISSLLHSVVAP